MQRKTYGYWRTLQHALGQHGHTGRCLRTAHPIEDCGSNVVWIWFLPELSRVEFLLLEGSIVAVLLEAPDEQRHLLCPPTPSQHSQLQQGLVCLHSRMRNEEMRDLLRCSGHCFD